MYHWMRVPENILKIAYPTGRTSKKVKLEKIGSQARQVPVISLGMIMFSIPSSGLSLVRAIKSRITS